MTNTHPAALTPDELASALCVTLNLPFTPGMEGHACIAAVIQVAVEAEREACAKVAEDASANSERGEHPRHEHIGAIGYECACDDIAEAIRARSLETDHDR